MPRDMSGRFEASVVGLGVPSMTAPKLAILRLDVDGDYPLNLASLEIQGSPAPVNVLFRLHPSGSSEWVGKAFDSRIDGRTVVPHSLLVRNIPKIQIRWSLVGRLPTVDLKFLDVSLGIALPTFERTSRFFRKWHLTCHAYQPDPGDPLVHRDTYHLNVDHDPDPAVIGVRSADLNIDRAFKRAGIEVEYPDGMQELSPTAVPADVEDGWSNSQMHDLMEDVWDRFVDAEQWACWLFLATEYNDPESTSTGTVGIMFDEIGEAPRQAAAVFTKRIDDKSHSVASGTLKALWTDRYKFFTAIHELGHCFNLAHSWEKEDAWLPTVSDPEARSFMNYPLEFDDGTGWGVSLPDHKFFLGDAATGAPAFEWRFTDSELTYLRHAPEQFVIPGGYDFLEEHGMEIVASHSAPGLRLRIEAPLTDLELFEPGYVDVILETPRGGTSHTVDPLLLSSTGDLVIQVTDVTGNSRICRPWIRSCPSVGESTVVDEDHLLRASVPVFAGRGGWVVDQEGEYQIRAAVEVSGVGVVVSDPVSVNVLPWAHPVASSVRDAWELERMTRYMLLRGSRSRRFERSRLAAQEIVDESPGSRLAIHAQYSLLRPRARHSYRLGDPGSSGDPIEIAEPGDPATVVPQVLDFLDQDDVADVLGETRLAISLREMRQALRAQRRRMQPDSETDLTTRIVQVFQARVRPELVQELRWESIDTN